MTPISVIVAAVMVYSVIAQHSDESGELDDIYRYTEYVCGLRKMFIGFRNSLNRFTDDDIVDDYVDDDSDLDKILGGKFVSLGDIPWMVNIYLDVRRPCGGVVIAEYWILSNAHCFDLRLRHYYRIVVGDYILSRDDKGQVSFSVEAIFLHEKYVVHQGDFDIALVKIAPTSDGRGIRFTDYVQPVCLPDPLETVSVGTLLTVSGWGVYTLANNESAQILKSTTVPVISNDECKIYYPRWISPNLICAGYKRSFTKPCAGDSGGPATVKIRGNTVLFGIVAFGYCWNTFDPTAFVNMPLFVNWIISHINRNKPGAQNYIPKRQTRRRPTRSLPPLPDDSDYIIPIVPYNASNTGR